MLEKISDGEDARASDKRAGISLIPRQQLLVATLRYGLGS
jgi:hypothetical protein